MALQVLDSPDPRDIAAKIDSLAFDGLRAVILKCRPTPTYPQLVIG